MITKMIERMIEKSQSVKKLLEQSQRLHDAAIGLTNAFKETTKSYNDVLDQLKKQEKMIADLMKSYVEIVAMLTEEKDVVISVDDLVSKDKKDIN